MVRSKSEKVALRNNSRRDIDVHVQRDREDEGDVHDRPRVHPRQHILHDGEYECGGSNKEQ